MSIPTNLGKRLREISDESLKKQKLLDDESLVLKNKQKVLTDEQDKALIQYHTKDILYELEWIAQQGDDSFIYKFNKALVDPKFDNDDHNTIIVNSVIEELYRHDIECAKSFDKNKLHIYLPKKSSNSSSNSSLNALTFRDGLAGTKWCA